MRHLERQDRRAWVWLSCAAAHYWLTLRWWISCHLATIKANILSLFAFFSEPRKSRRHIMKDNWGGKRHRISNKAWKVHTWCIWLYFFYSCSPVFILFFFTCTQKHSSRTAVDHMLQLPSLSLSLSLLWTFVVSTSYQGESLVREEGGDGWRLDWADLLSGVSFNLHNLSVQAAL